MFIVFGVRRLTRNLGRVGLRCANCGAVGLVLVRVARWFALFFVPVVPLGSTYVSVCPNCKRQERVAGELARQAQAAPAPQGAAAGAVPAAAAPPAPAPAPRPGPGWFVDEQAGVQRYWDGERWTEHTAPLGS